MRKRIFLSKGLGAAFARPTRTETRRSTQLAAGRSRKGGAAWGAFGTWRFMGSYE